MLGFYKYPALHELELRHGVDLGQAYKTKDSAKLFSHYIAEGQRQELFDSLSTSRFYSFLMMAPLIKAMWKMSLSLSSTL